MTTGYIPKTIRYIVQPASVITPKIKYLKPGESPEEIKVASTWVGDADIKKTSENALRRHGFGQPGNEGVKNIELPNSEIPYIEIYDTGYKGEYRGRVLDRFYVGIRQIVIDEALVYGEVRDGKIIGPFVWANSGGMNLVKVGSKLHMEIIEAGTRRYKNKLKDDEIELGKIYLDRQGNRHAYVGEFWLIENSRAYDRSAQGYTDTLRWRNARFFVSPGRADKFEDMFSPREPDESGNYRHASTSLDWLVQKSAYSCPKLIGKPVGEFSIPEDFTTKIREMAKIEAEAHYAGALAMRQQQNRAVPDNVRRDAFLGQISHLTFRRPDERPEFNLPMLPELPPVPTNINPPPGGVHKIDDDPIELPDDIGLDPDDVPEEEDDE